MEEKLKDYLHTLITPLLRGEFEVIEEDSDEGKTFVVIVKDREEAGILVGENGNHANAIRTMMRTYSGVLSEIHKMPKVWVNVLIAKPSRIKTKYI